MRAKFLVVIASVAVAGIAGIVGSVYAQTTRQPLTQQAYNQQRREVIAETEEQIKQLHEDEARECQLTAQYLRGEYAESQLTLDYRLSSYQVVLDQTNQLAIAVESRDESAVDLRVDLAELSDLVGDFSADYSLYQGELFEAANIACNEQTELRSTVSRALSALRTAEHQAEQVEDYARGALTDTLNQMTTEAADE